jgi:hypothetical protein
MILSATLFAVTLTAAPTYAQQQAVVTASDIDAALAEDARSTDGDRARIRQFLHQAAVTATMHRMGIDADRLRASVAMLSDAETREFADRVDAASEAQAGGDVLVISTTTVIIALLIVLIIVAADD